MFEFAYRNQSFENEKVKNDPNTFETCTKFKNKKMYVFNFINLIFFYE